MTDAKYELVYYPIRGLGAPARAALIFNGIDFVDNRTNEWWTNTSETGPRAKIKLPFANLPSLILPNGEALTQTATILRFIAKLGELKPKSDIDEANISMVIDHLMEFNAEKFKMSYPSDALENIPSFFEKSVPYYLGTLEEWMTTRKTEFVATNYISVADIFLVEFICALEKCKQCLSWMEKYGKLVEVYGKVTSHPKLKEYYEKEKAVPHNNPHFAKWY